MVLPIAWSEDGSAVYALSEVLRPPRVIRYPLGAGEPDTVSVLPFEDVSSVAASPDLGEFICSVEEASADAWLVEGLDLRSARER